MASIAGMFKVQTMPKTARAHFEEDVARARAIIAHADPLPVSTAVDRMLRSDLLRSAWMFSVGSLDAYFCDAYTDVLAATIISKNRHAAMVLPEFFYNIKFPVRAILEPYDANTNWRWRMAARKMMERENILSLDEVKKLFNKFFREGHKFFGDTLLDAWIVHPRSKKRLFGTTRQAYPPPTPADKHDARRLARRQLDERFEAIIQRRHDCIHNCDRPRTAPQPLVKAGTVLKVVEDVEFLVHRCDEHIESEIRQFLLSCGCPITIIAQAGY